MLQLFANFFRRQNVKEFLSLLLAGIVSLSLLIGCGVEQESNRDNSSTNLFIIDQTSPVFNGIILAYSPQKDKINVHWAQASDNITQPDKIKYNIYASPLSDINTIYQDSNLIKSLLNQTNYSIENLLPGQTYYCLVVAEDERGNRNNEHKIFEVSTMPDDLQTQMMPKDLTKADITKTANSADNFTFTGVGTNDLKSNDIIMVDNESGQILKKVVSTELTETGVTVTTEDASLSEVIKSGVLKSNVLLTDLNNIPSSQEIALKTTIAGKVQTMPAKQYNDPAGFFKVTESISDNHYLPHKILRKNRFDLYEHETSLNESVELGYSIKFNPGIETEARYTESWGIDPLEYVKVVAKGMISIDALAEYYLNGESKLSLKKQLLNRGLTLTYSMGPVPVYQEVYLEIFAELNMDTNANLAMATNLKASKDIEIGVEWDREKGWNAIRNEGFDQEITFNVEAGGTVVGTLKVYPVISVRFYKAVKSSLYVVPTLVLDSAARIIPPPFELTKFDVNFLVDSYIAANLKVLGLVLAEWESNHYELLNIPIFSLPEIYMEYSGVSLSAGTTQKYSLGIKDGVHNTIPPENIVWSVEPNAGVTLEPINGNTEAILTALSEGEYTVNVLAYGDGFLGTIGTRYASFPLTVIAANDTTSSTVSSTSTLNVNINGMGRGTVTSLPEGINCETVCSVSFTDSSSITLTATPASGSTFSGWSGECTGTGTCTVVMDTAISVTATFEKVGLAPSAPTNVTGVADNGQVTISWDAVSGAESYNLYMASEFGVTKSNYSTLADGMKHIGVTSPYTHTGLTNGEVYYFVVMAVNTNGESAESNQISITPVAPLSSNEIILFSSFRDSNWEVYRMNGDGSNQNNISNDPAIDSSPAYFPDGNKIIFISTRECSEGKLYVMNSDGTNVDRLPVGFSNAPDGSVFCEPFVLSSPKYSPDGTKIVFRGNVVPGGPSPGNTQIYIMNSDGSNIINLSNNSFFDKDPVFTPDGQKILFSSYRDGNYEIYVMNIDGSNQIKLTNVPGDDELPGISPDGSKITFTSNRDGNYEIYVMDIDGNNQTNLTNSSAADGNSMFSSDGRQIALISNRDGNYELYLMNSNGTNLYRLTNTLADELQPFFRWNPSGNQFPIVQINSPESYSSFIHGTSLTFAGTSLDPEDGTMQGAFLVWSSNKDGKIGEGSSFSISSLSANTHMITLIATDSQGATSTSSINITIHPEGTLPWQGTQQIGTASDDYAYDMAVNANRNIYVIGSTYGGLDGNTNVGGEDIFLIKYDYFGVKQWTRQIGTSNGNVAYDIAADSGGNAYVTGYTDGGLNGNNNIGLFDFFVGKYDPSGANMWTRQSGTANSDIASAVAVGSSDNVYITGWTDGGLDGNTNMRGSDIFLIKYDSSGIKQWSRQIGTGNDDYAYDVAVDSSNNIYVTGRTLGNIDGNTTAGGYDAFLIKYDSSGTKQWSRQIGTEYHDTAFAMAVDSNSNVYITGWTDGDLDGNTNIGGSDIFLIKYDSSGTKQWSRQIGTIDGERSNGIAFDSSGNVYITGWTYSGQDGNPGGLDGNTNIGGSDIFLIKYDSSGAKEWSRQIGTIDGDYPYGVAVDSNDNIYITGYTYGNLDGNTNTGGADVFIVKYDSSGVKQ